LNAWEIVFVMDVSFWPAKSNASLSRLYQNDKNARRILRRWKLLTRLREFLQQENRPRGHMENSPMQARIRDAIPETVLVTLIV
jgi:hypothetical protein